MEIDPERGPMIRWAFEQYATGDHTVVELLDEVTARGLRTLPTPSRPPKPVALLGFFAMLRNPISRWHRPLQRRRAPRCA